MNIFSCEHCHQQVYFDNMTCLNCGAVLAFVPTELVIGAFVLSSNNPNNHTNNAPSSLGFFTRLGGHDGAPCAWRPCIHRTGARGCNWAVAASDPNPECISCRLTQSEFCAPECGHESRWYSAESAKRRLLYTLLSLGLPLRAKQHAHDWAGLAFVWKVPQEVTQEMIDNDEEVEQVMTGHNDGTITLNLLEADDDLRESNRVAFNEPLRTVLGHLRHEVAHYLDMRFVDTDHDLSAEFFYCFGDKQRDYTQALQSYYQYGAQPDWQQRHISAYASVHPWEDWAETCAHYLLMVDAVETASAWGLRLDLAPDASNNGAISVANLSAKRLVLKHWLPVSRFLNNMARSIGLRDNYPFVIASTVLDKLDFVQYVLHEASLSYAEDKKAPWVQYVQPSPVAPYTYGDTND